jgi:hypothetical protein
MIGASPQQVATLYAAISGAQAAAAAASEAADAVLGTATDSVAGVTAGGDAAALATAFANYLGTAEQAPDLFDLENYLTRMADNLTISNGV